MPQDKKGESVADFLNGITEAPEVFEETIVSPEDEPEVEEEGKPLPFHEDPKVQRYVEKQIKKALENHKPSVEQQFRKEVEEEINLPSSFIKLVGNDTDEKKQVLKDLSNYFGTLKGEARQEFLAELKEQEAQQVAEDNAALDELNAGLETIEEEHGIDFSKDARTRTAFIEFLRKVSHKNADGEVDQFADIPSAWETFQERSTKSPTASRAKELASRGMTRSNDVSAQSSGFKSGTRDPWAQVEKHFDTLKGNN